MGTDEGPIAVRGVVEAKECKCCGHHEIGLRVDKADGGGYIQLKPGDRIDLEVTETAFYRRLE